MADRYVATFDSLHPEHGVVVDEVEGRYCIFPSVQRAERAAARWNAPPLWDADPPMAWRSTQTGELLTQESADPWPDTEDAAAAHYAACNPEPGGSE